jgi:DNA-binding SARP family transcriptional activator/DNA-binding beta-propeller fold protein YncE/ABC-type branched-subunit amino acid transport system substrate-binding protein
LSIRLTRRATGPDSALFERKRGCYGRSTTKGLSFRILGPFEVAGDEGVRHIAGAKQRALLVILLLERGQVVTADRLIEELWAGRPPTRPEKTLHVYVSQLRRTLGNGQPRRNGAGYMLDVAAESIDAGRFEQLVRQGSELRAAGELETAEATLTNALSLWRGPPLADFAYESFAQGEIARLEELRLVALEERAEALLGLGRHVEVIPELEALVREHPSRERVAAVLMLALYRAGRQEDALDAYGVARARMDEELGLEPGAELQDLQRRILNHDPALGAPAAGDWLSRIPVVGTRGRAAALLVLGALLALAAAIGAAIVETRAGPDDVRLGSVAPDSVAVIDPDSNAIVAGVRVGSAPTAIAVGEDAVWVGNAGDRTVTRIDPARKRAVETIHLSRIPDQLVVGDGAIWVANPIGFKGTVTRIDPESNAATTSAVRVGDGGDAFSPPTPSAIAVNDGAVWTNSMRASVAVLRPQFASAVRTIDLGPERSSDGIAVGEGAVWVTSSANDTLLRLDPRSGRVVAEIPMAAVRGERVAGPYGVAVGYGSVWVTDALGNALTRVDPDRNVVVATVGVGRRPTRLAVGEGAVWVLNAGDGTVSRVDPDSARVEATIPVGSDATSIAAGEGSVWVTVAGGSRETLVGGARPQVEAVGTPACSKVIYDGGGTPDVLIVSDLPTYLLGRPSAQTRQMRDAIRFVLANHRFRAGKYKVAYQACDDSTPSEGTSAPERCAANARAYARNAGLVGIVGTLHSSCAQIELPILNAAPNGPLAMISPANTYVGLTHGGPGTTAPEPERYYPTGARNYARVIPPDDAQGAALGVLASQLGAKRLYLLHDGQGYGYAIARYAGAAARRLGVTIAGIAAWDPETADQAALARMVARSEPDAVVLGGCVCANGLPLIEALRSMLGPRPKLLAPDAFTPSEEDYSLIRKAANGLYITVAGLPSERLPLAGRRFTAAFSPGRAPSEIDPYVVYAAQATEVLLAAIKRSNGTRPSVTSEVLATRVTNGLIGSFAFDQRGNPTRAPIAVYRIDFSDNADTAEWLPMPAVLDRVMTPHPPD